MRTKFNKSEVYEYLQSSVHQKSHSDEMIDQDVMSL